ncbi:ElyC/SanA/YdcF family protein [Clostridium sp. YIM B02551]|uniref:ElyC/SanA/YdcF family protein n=1 Tax=Clostridium sp. YIM B02551 TaxID=2910679 RepID=UPI001EEBA720|nr:ElyC/SanA/YdcF family protein [Clostridium sp. YIM B02551]
MSSKDINEIAEAFNTITKFLAAKDIEELSADELLKKYGIKKVDLLVILGNAIPFIAEEGARAFKNNLAHEIMIVGGVGHSTKYLVNNIKNSEKYKDIHSENRAEADILKDIIIKYEEVEEEKIIIENRSTNCGANADEAYEVLKRKRLNPKTILLMQDPTMQLRTCECFKETWKSEEVVLINYAAFVPRLREAQGNLEFADNNIYGLWDMERFISLIMGEIPRLRDDEKGYGPKGSGFIGHVDIPEEVNRAYEMLTDLYAEYIR